MQLTTRNIIQVLPFDQAFKDELFAKYQTLPEEGRIDITMRVWDLYYALYKLKLDENLELAYEGDVPLASDFYKKIREKTDRQMHEEISVISTSADLSIARDELQVILNRPSG